MRPHFRVGSIAEHVTESSATPLPEHTAHIEHMPLPNIRMTDGGSTQGQHPREDVSANRRPISITITPPSMAIRQQMDTSASTSDSQPHIHNHEPTDEAHTPITLSDRAEDEVHAPEIHVAPDGSIVSVDGPSTENADAHQSSVIPNEAPQDFGAITKGQLRLLRFQKHEWPKMEYRSSDSIKGSRLLVCQSTSGQDRFTFKSQRFMAPSQDSRFAPAMP